MTSDSETQTGDDIALQDALEREAATREILQIISRSRDDEKPVFDAILENAARLCDAPMASLNLLDENGTRLVLRAHWGTALDHFEPDVTEWPLDGLSAPAQAVRESRLVHIEDFAETEAYKSGDPVRVSSVKKEGIRTFLAVPLMRGGKAVGCIALFRREVRPFDDGHVDLVKAFAAQAVIAIENVRQFRELQTRLERETATREILYVISQSRADEQPVFEAILRNAARLLESPAGGGLHLLNEARTHSRLVGSWGDDSGTFPAGWEAELAGSLPQSIAMRETRIVHTPDIKTSQTYLSGDPDMVKKADVDGVRTFLCVPLVKDGVAIGCFNLNRYDVKPYSEAEIALAETFAQQAVIAIENVRQFRELQTRLEREAATRQILEVISRSRDDEQPVFDVILENARRLCEANMGAFILGREGGGSQVMVAHRGVTEATLELYRAGQYTMDPETSLAARAIIERRAIHVEDMADTDAYRRGDPRFRLLVDEQGIRTNLLVPLILQGEGIGCLILFRQQVRPYSDDQIALIQTFAAQAVIAIENVRQFRELQTRLEREAATRQILEVISKSRADEKPVFDAILENASRLCNSPLAYLSMANEERTHVTVPAHRGSRPKFAASLDDLLVPIKGSKLALVRSITECDVIRMDDIADDELYRNREPNRVSMVESEGARSLLAVPLISGGRGIGAIILYRREVAPFSDDHVALAESFAAQAVIAVENVKQFKALQARTEEVQALNENLESRVATQVDELERLGRLKRFLSPQVADAVLSSGNDKLLSSHRALIATLFCDMRGFTAFCETAEPEEAIEVLQAYHEEMGTLIGDYGAGVDHRSGDGIMVIFNDPLPCDSPAEDAVKLALAMRERMARLCADWRELGHRLGFGVGISLGYATVGVVGSAGRYDYTASGTAVNLAARLCDQASDGEVLLSPRAYRAVEDAVVVESAGELTLKGIQAPVEVVRVIRLKDAEVPTDIA